ncbi:MAG: glycosyltransferase family 2 protein [Gemmatimonadota bacterium]
MNDTPFLSVVVPAKDAADTLADTLPALTSEYPPARWELIVVVDGDDAETRAVAERYADTVLGLPGQARGPAYARNRGAEVAEGSVIVFVDADVRVHRDALRRISEVFLGDPHLGAVFGSYDDRPEARGLVSRYRNLLHHAVHQESAGEAETFWAGCGAVRATAFREVGGFDEWHFARPQIEDIELGRRLRLRGYRILLDPGIQGTHLKRWRLREVLLTDLKHRGLPWARLLLHEGWRGTRLTLNLTKQHRWSVLLAAVAVLALPVALWMGRPVVLAVGALAAAGVVALNRSFYAVLGRRCGWIGAVVCVPLHLLHYIVGAAAMAMGWVVYSIVGPPQPPPGVAAFEEVGLKTWPPVPSRPRESVWYRYGRPRSSGRRSSGPPGTPSGGA